jgi:hypothetical protein
MRAGERRKAKGVHSKARRRRDEVLLVMALNDEKRTVMAREGRILGTLLATLQEGRKER